MGEWGQEGREKGEEEKRNGEIGDGAEDEDIREE